MIDKKNNICKYCRYDTSYSSFSKCLHPSIMKTHFTIEPVRGRKIKWKSCIVNAGDDSCEGLRGAGKWCGSTGLFFEKANWFKRVIWNNFSPWYYFILLSIVWYSTMYIQYHNFDYIITWFLPD